MTKRVAQKKKKNHKNRPYQGAGRGFTRKDTNTRQRQEKKPGEAPRSKISATKVFQGADDKEDKKLYQQVSGEEKKKVTTNARHG